MSADVRQFQRHRTLGGLRVFVDGRMSANTGIGTHLLEHLRGLSKLGAELTVSFSGAGDELIRSFVPSARLVRVVAPYYGWRERLRRFVIPAQVGRQDVHWFPQYNVPYFLPPRSIVTVHDLIQFRYNLKFKKKLMASFAKHVLFRAVGQADRVVCPSSSTRNDLLDFLCAYDPADNKLFAKTKVVRNGVSRTWARQTPEALAEARKLVEGGPYLLCVGNGKPHKNLQLVLTLGRKLALSGYSHKVVMVGPADRFLLDQMRPFELQHSNLLKRIDRVPSDVLAALYAGAAAVLTPSLYEGFGLPPIEAMMAGAPVIASNRGGLPEAVGDGGVLLDPLDEQAWLSEVSKLLNTDHPEYRNERIARGRRWASGMSWQAATAELAVQIAEVAGLTVDSASPGESAHRPAS